MAAHVEPPSPVARDKDKETARAEALNRAGVLSKATWSKWEGLDRNRERRLLEREKPQDQSPGGDRGGFTEEARRLLEACRPHKSGPFKGTEIGYDPDKHNANCRLSGTNHDEKQRAKHVAQFIDALADQLCKDRELGHPISCPFVKELFGNLTPEQRDQLFQLFQDNRQRWDEEASNQKALQRELAKDPELARELEETVAKLRAEFEKATPELAARSRRQALPWLYEKNYQYFAPAVTTGPDGQPEFAFARTAASRRLQLLQALFLDVRTVGGGPNEPHVGGRMTAFHAPRTDTDAMAWYQLFGATSPDNLAQIS
jgi:hypothetical protein